MWTRCKRGRGISRNRRAEGIVGAFWRQQSWRVGVAARDILCVLGREKDILVNMKLYAC